MPPSNDTLPISQHVAQLFKLLQELSQRSAACHPEFNRQVAFRLALMVRQLAELAEETLTFQATETWRTVYERVLAMCQTERYLSVALIRTDNYWQDLPGQTSLEFNFKLIEQGFSVERTFIIDPFFWPPAARTPAKNILSWIFAQYKRGVTARLVRLSDIEEEHDLIADFGIYGDDAVGKQVVDFEGKTQKFEINFGEDRVREAEERWDRLLLYSVLLDDLIADQKP